MTEPLTKAAQDFVWTLFAGCQHDNEGHDLQAVERYMVRRWSRNAARVTPTPDTRLREALTSWYAVDGESWRLVAMDRDGGIVAAGIPEALLDAIIRRATREETT